MTASPMPAPSAPAPAPVRTGTSGGLVFDVRGDGPPVVLVHGLGSSRRAFDVVAALLAPHATTYAVDLPGHGDTPVTGAAVMTPRDLAVALGRFLDAEGLERAHLVGNSMGGWTVLEAAADGRALSVTALCPAGMWDQPLLQRGRALSVNRAISRASQPLLPFLLRSRRVRSIGFASAAVRGDLLDYDVALQAARDQARTAGYDACSDGLLGPGFARRQEIPDSVPVTVLFGDRDGILPAPRFQVRAMAPEHARWVVQYRCGHAPMWDAPVVTVDTVLRTAAAATPS